MEMSEMLAMSPFAILSLAVFIGMFKRLARGYLFADIYESKKYAKVLATIGIAGFWFVIAQVVNLKMEFTMGTGFLCLALLGGALAILVNSAPVRAGE
jgi:hypothetical protein